MEIHHSALIDGLYYSRPIANICFYFCREFVRIETWEQRNRYKAIFNSEYEEYKRLYAKFNGIAQEFSTLEEDLKRCEAGSEARAVSFHLV
jgi:hypothetical protein